MPKPEIILFGDEEGTAQICQELGLRYAPEIAHNEFGTPLLNDVFEQAQRLATYDLLCYVNADIILMSDFVQALQRVIRQMNNFLLFSQRWDVEIDKNWDFDSIDWEANLRKYAVQCKQTGPHWGLADYFVFPRGTLQNIPPLAIGRTACDNYLIYRARAHRLSVINATDAIMIIHQKHDYSHHPQNAKGVWAGLEARDNWELTGGGEYNEFGLYDATHLLTLSALKRTLGLRYILRSLEATQVLYPRLRVLWPLVISVRLSVKAWEKCMSLFIKNLPEN